MAQGVTINWDKVDLSPVAAIISTQLDKAMNSISDRVDTQVGNATGQVGALRGQMQAMSRRFHSEIRRYIAYKFLYMHLGYCSRSGVPDWANACAFQAAYFGAQSGRTGKLAYTG